MEKTIIINKTYKVTLVTIIILSLMVGLISLITASSFSIWLSILLSVILLVLIWTGNKHLQLIIRIMSGVAIIGCIFRFASIALLLIGQLFHEIKPSSVIEITVSFSILLYLYIGSKKYIKTINTEEVSLTERSL